MVEARLPGCLGPAAGWGGRGATGVQWIKGIEQAVVIGRLGGRGLETEMLVDSGGEDLARVFTVALGVEDGSCWWSGGGGKGLMRHPEMCWAMWVGTDVEVREWWKDWKWLREQVREQQPRGVVRVCVCVCGLLSAWDEVGVSMVTLDVGSVRGTTIQDGEWRVVIVSGTGMGGWNPLGEVEPKVLNDKFSR